MNRAKLAPGGGLAKPALGVRALISVLDLFRVGIGPSSSHTVGPMRIARRFLRTCVERGVFEAVERVHIELQGSLALTGPGHGTVTAVILGLLGHEPGAGRPGGGRRRGGGGSRHRPHRPAGRARDRLHRAAGHRSGG